jgi:hypothetical protein
MPPAMSKNHRSCAQKERWREKGRRMQAGKGGLLAGDNLLVARRRRGSARAARDGDGRQGSVRQRGCKLQASLKREERLGMQTSSI